MRSNGGTLEQWRAWISTGLVGEDHVVGVLGGRAKRDCRFSEIGFGNRFVDNEEPGGTGAVDDVVECDDYLVGVRRRLAHSEAFNVVGRDNATPSSCLAFVGGR